LAINLIGLSTSYLKTKPFRGVYYDANLELCLDASADFITQAGLFWRHLVSGRQRPSDFGLSTRWFVFLHKAGVSGL